MGRLSVSGATTATLYLSAATNFVNYHNVNGNASRRASALLKNAMKRSYDDALSQELKVPQYPALLRTYEYDITTEPGMEYRFERAAGQLE